jgi:hypothetical protein
MSRAEEIGKHPPASFRLLAMNEIDPPRPSWPSDEVTNAHHEAGHAVAAHVLLGASSILRVALDPPDRPWLAGVCRLAGVDPLGVAFGWHALAGPAASQIIAELKGWPRPPFDSEDAAKARAAFGGRLERWRARDIETWLRGAAVWPWVETLAGRLLAGRVLEGDEVREALLPMGWPAPNDGYTRDIEDRRAISASARPSDFLNRGGLRRRGWPPSLVRDLLGSPDALVPNPRNPAWPPMPLFARERVEAAEQGARFRAAYARLQARVRAGRAGGAAHA